MQKLLDVYWNKILIGDVLKNENEYIFKYNKQGVEKAKEDGFKYIIGFKNINQEYFSKNLFPVFSSRVPPKNRHDINEFLKKIGLSEYNEVEILKKTNGKCLTDKMELR